MVFILWRMSYHRCMTSESTILIGVEVGLLKGLESMKWAIESLQRFVEISAVSTVVQCRAFNDKICLRTVIKATTSQTAEQVIQELISIEYEYDEKLRVIESLRCFLLTYEQQVNLSPGMILPHPQMLDHSSWLYCAWETSRNYRHPVLEQTLDKLISKTNMADIIFFGQGKSIITKSRVS